MLTMRASSSKQAQKITYACPWLAPTGLLMGIDMFQRNSFGVLFLLFYLFESAMVGGAYLSAVFIRRAHPATTYTLCVFVVGWICQVSLPVVDVPPSCHDTIVTPPVRRPVDATRLRYSCPENQVARSIALISQSSNP